MKAIAIPIFALSVALTALSCQPVDNSKAIAKADSIAQARLQALTDSVMKACMDEVMTTAKHRADSMMAAAMKKPTGSKKQSSAHPKKEEPTGGTVQDRPGTTQQGPQSVTDRPGTQQQGPTSVKDRKGATQQQPPK
ncbi:MAG: hypothetical protein NZL95_00670 [Chitinophagales bacterium]|nr:hypothetical protein [Chitinophagales bacterium]MDW8427052.1 hypothetical protein [Chitinophagales bacterium]